MSNDTQTGPLKLYELVLENGRSASPFVWRIRFALAHKGLACELVPLGFTEIPKMCGGRFKTVPILEHGATAMAESWDIADYLDRTFPDRPKIFSGPAEQAMTRLFDTWLLMTIVRPFLLPLYLLDIYNAARPEDRPYFRQSREARLGKSLEAITADRAALLPAARESLAPLRFHLATHAFLGGSAPNYADYAALGIFQWAGSFATLPLLAADDTVLRGWIERGFDLYGGLGRDARMKPLFA